MGQEISSGETAASSPTSSSLHEGRSRRGLWGLALGALGVVYGDIGTSPLYALKETLLAAVGGDASTPIPREFILGILSLIAWSLIVVVTLKYVVLLMRGQQQRGRRHPDARGACPARRRPPGKLRGHPAWNAVFLYVAPSEVMEVAAQFGATPFDVDGADVAWSIGANSAPST